MDSSEEKLYRNRSKWLQHAHRVEGHRLQIEFWNIAQQED